MIEKQLPINKLALRIPGQSLDERLRNLADGFLRDNLLAWTVVMLTLLEWWRWYAQIKPSPLVYSLLAFVAVLFAVFRSRMYLVAMRRVKLGLDGEVAVGQYLENLREDGYRILHDVVGKDFNIDHVLIGPAGVFTVETKTYRKPKRGDAIIEVRSDELTLNGQPLPRNPIRQCKAQAHWLREYLRECGINIDVLPVVVFPGWFVRPHQHTQVGMWVLEPKALPGFLRHETNRLTAQQIASINSALSRYVRGA